MTTRRVGSRIKEAILPAVDLALNDSNLANPFSLFLTHSSKLKLTTGERVEVSPSQRNGLRNLARLMSGYGVEVRVKSGVDETAWKLDPERGVVTTPSGLNFTLDSVDPGIFSETFIYETHFVDFDLSNLTIVEAGGFVGDTGLYYAQHGARVITLEPDPINFARLQRNLLINRDIADKITPVNAAIGADGDMSFTIGKGGGSSKFGTRGIKTPVKSYSIGTILKRFDITSPFLLALDVKGSEPEVLADSAISEFERFRMEYCFTYWPPHPLRSVGAIKSVLHDRGFRKVRFFKHIKSPLPLREHGTIEATK